MSDQHSDTRKVSGLALSAGFFSQVPMPAVGWIGQPEARRALRWLPVVGMIAGLIGGVVGTAVGLAAGNCLLGAAVCIASVQLLVGGTHLDGLADTFDGLAALGSRKEGRDAARALEIMKAPDTGAMGVIVLVLVLGVQILALGSAASTAPPWGLVFFGALGPAVGRVVILTASRRGVPSARPGGFGALFSDVTPVAHAVIGNLGLAAVAGAGAWALLGVTTGLGVALSVLLAEGFGWWWCRRIVARLGGTTGDVFGALIETCCTMVWVGCAMATGLGSAPWLP